MKARIQDKFRTLFGEGGQLFASAGRIRLESGHLLRREDRRPVRNLLHNVFR